MKKQSNFPSFPASVKQCFSGVLAAVVAVWQVGQPLQAVDFYWDPDETASGNNVDGTGLGGTGLWDTTTLNWWNGASLVPWPNLNTSRAIFSGPVIPAIPHTVTVSPGILANQLRFHTGGYTLTGGDITLDGAGAGFHVTTGATAVVDSLVGGASGLTLSGGGVLRLGNNANTYTGQTIIGDGALIISHPGALGLDTSAISVVSGNMTPSNTAQIGFRSGSLVLDGTAGGFTLARDINLEGRGLYGDRSGALLSFGNNTLSGVVTTAFSNLTPTTFRNTRIVSGDGVLTLSGTLNVQGTAVTTFTGLGGVNQAGASFYDVTGILTGTGSLEASGGGTLFLNPTDSSGFSGTVRVSGSVASGQSVVRIDSPNVLGTRTATASNAVLDLNGTGILAILMDNPSVLAGGAPAHVYSRNSTASLILVDHAVGSSAINQTVQFGQLGFAAGAGTTLHSRNGFNVQFSSAPVVTGDNNATITNSLQGGGVLTFTGNVWSNTNNAANRTLTIAGNGNTLLTSTANLNASAAAFDHNLTKSGVGILTILSTASTLDGNVSIQQGAIRLNDFRGLNLHAAGTNTGGINMATSSNAAILEITGNNVNQANLTTNKLITMSGSTGGATILANQTGTSPGLLLNGNIGGTGTGTNAKTLILGGNNTANNTVNGIISNTGAGATINLHKTDPGLWILAGANTYGGTTTLSNGTLRLFANADGTSTVMPDTSAIIFNANTLTAVSNTNRNFQSAGGTFEFLSTQATATNELAGALTPTAGAGFVRTTAAGAGSATLTFASLGARGAGATINYQPGANTNIAFTALPAVTNGILGAANATAFQVVNGLDWATLSGSNVVAFNGYTVNGLPATGTGSATVNFAMNADHTTTGTATINSLKLIGGVANPTLTLGGRLTVNARALIFDNSGGPATINGSILGADAVEMAFFTNGIIPANALTINSVIGGTSGQLTKGGTGTLVIGGANTYTGNTHINLGTVRLSGAAATLGAPAAGSVLNLRQDATLDLNAAGPGGVVTIGGLNGNGTILNSGGGSGADSTLVIGPANGTAGGTFTGSLQDGAGVLHVVKNGTGTQTQWGNNTYTGVTTINGSGLLAVEMLASGGLPSSIGASSSAASNLVFGGASTAANTGLFGALSYFGSQSIEIDRLFTFAGTAPNSGARILANGLYTLATGTANHSALQFTNSGPLAFATPDIDQGLSLGGTSTGGNRFSPQITDNGTGRVSLFKLDAGLWHLNNDANSYTGVTNVFGGMLSASSGTTLPSASPLNIMGGQFYSTGAFTRNATAVLTPGNLNEVQVGTGNSGFAAGASKLVVALGGVGTEQLLTWGNPEFNPTQFTLNSTVSFSDVEFRNPIDLNGATRTVSVLDNTLIGADFATMSGALSGGAGSNLVKTGAGILYLTGNSTYTGTTQISQGTLVVKSLGLSTTPGASSVGDSTLGASDSGAILIGNGTTGGAILEYVGAGETSDRKIRLNTTTANNQIHADGAGALILTNVVNDAALGAKTLFLRGVSPAANRIESNLSDNGGALSITVDGGTAWVLTGNNTHTGTTNATAGALGIGSDTALGTGGLNNNNGNIFAYGGDRNVPNTLTLTNNATNGWMGDYSLTFTNVTHGAGANNVTTNNSIATGKMLTFNGLAVNSLTSNRTWTIDGPGETVLNGNFTTTHATFGLAITKVGNGTLTLGTNGGASNWNQNNQNIDLDRGTLRFTASEAIPSGAGAGGLIISPEIVTMDVATLDLNGTTQTVRALTATTDGTVIIDNTSASPATFRFGAGDATVNLGGGTGTYTIQNSGGGALSLVKLGNTSTIIPSGVSFNHQGTTRVEGGSLTIGSPINGSTALEVTANATLALTGGITAPSAVTSLVVENGGVLNLLDGAGNKLNNLNNLQLGSMGGTLTTMFLNVGDLNVVGDQLGTDTLTLQNLGTLSLFTGNQVRLNLTNLGLNPGGTYELISAPGGGLTTGALGVGDWILGNKPGGFTSIDMTATDTSIFITVGSEVTGTTYWRGALGGGVDNTWNASATNWSQDKAGTIAAVTTPGQGMDVIFQWDAPNGNPVVTTLDQNFKVKTLTFEDATTLANTASSITIDPGSLATNRLEIAPAAATDGIRLATTNATAATISGPVRLGADQTWDVVNAGSTLSLGSLLGGADVTKTGPGKVTLTAAADPTFNSGLTVDLAINAGTVELTNSAALGNAVNSNLANVALNPGGAFYYNGAASTVANPIAFNGGTLSAGTANQTYSGAITMNANSVINMRDMNAATGTTARNITLSGIITGGGGITLDSSTTVSAGNQIAGTLTLNNNNNTWTGPLNILRGTVITTQPNALTTGDITISLGKIEWQGPSNATYTVANNITIGDAAANAIGELQVNATGTVTTPFTVNYTGTITLGGTGGTGELRVFLADQLNSVANYNGPIVLANNAAIHVRDNATNAITTVNGVISETGGSHSLIVNGPAGGGTAWGGTAGILRLTADNTFTGDLQLNAGSLEFTTVNDVGGGPSNLGQGTTIRLQGGTLRFVGGVDESTDRPITMTGGATLAANGAGGASITYMGAISAAGNTLTLTGLPGSPGILSGGLIQTGTTADININSGNWTFTGSPLFVADDVVMTGGSTLTLAAPGILDSGSAIADAALFVRGDSTVRLAANDAIVGGTGNTNLRRVSLADGTTAGTGTLDLNGFNFSIRRIDLGAIAPGFTGMIEDSGTITLLPNLTDYNDGFRVFRGSISSGTTITGTGTLLKQGLDTVTMANTGTSWSGNNASRIDSGELILDFTVNNDGKIPSNVALDMRGGRLTIQGNDNSTSVQNVASFTLANGGQNTIAINPGAGQTAILDLGAITRNAAHGTLRYLPQPGSSLKTSTANGAHGLLGASAYLTIKDDTGTWFARNDGGNNIVPFISTVKNDIATWVAGDHVSSSAGFTGSLANGILLGSLRFDSPIGSSLSMPTHAGFGIDSGGILITDTVGVGAPGIFGGTLSTTSNDVIIRHDGAADFTLSSNIRLTSAVTKAGNGTLKLSGNNTFSGVLNIQGGTLIAAGGNAIGDNAPVTLSDDHVSTFELHASETIGRLSGGNSTTGLNLLATVNIGAHTLTINQTGANTAFGGFFTGSGTIIKNGFGTNTNLNIQNISTGFTGKVVVNEGLFQMSSIGQIDATSFTVNRNGVLLIDNNGGTRSGTRILDTATVTLNSANGAFSGETRPRGLALRTDQDSTTNTSETIGVLTFASGGNYGVVDNSGGGSSRPTLTAADFVRLENATLNVRGRNLGDTGSVARSQFRITGTGTNEVTFVNTMTGGSGLTISPTVDTTDNSKVITFTTGTTDGLVVGQSITGTGIPAGAVIASIDGPNQVTLNLNATATGTGVTATVTTRHTVTRSVSTVDTSPIVTLEAGTTDGLVVGQAITGTGIPAGTVILTIDGPTQITLSQNATATTAPTTPITASLFSRSNSIVPWAIGERYTGGGLGDANMGNTLLTYVAGSGLTPLNLTTEYNTYALAGALDNTREVLDADLTGLAGKGLNSLVLHNNISGASSTFNVTGLGAGNALAVNSGAFLFTLNTGATASSSNGIVLSGFDDGITVGATNEYIFHVVNPSSATTTPTLTATISSPLTSMADITKTGRGTLVLTTANTAGGGTRRTTLNEGILEIADLDNIGGDTGDLVFAGGTLRLGAGFTDDISMRTITIHQGGATLDTNGNDLVLAGSMGSGAGGLTKIGNGTLTLNASATYAGPTVLTTGALVVGANNALGVGGDLSLAGGTTLDFGAFNLTHDLVSTSGASPALLGTGTISASRGFFFNHTGASTIDAVLAGTGGLLKAQNTSLTLNGANTYSGMTEIQAGTIFFNSIASVGGGASSFGAPTTVENGIIRLGLTTAATTLIYNGAGHDSDRILGLQGTTGGFTLNADGAGMVGFGGISGLNPGVKTVLLGGASDPANLNRMGGILDGAAAISLIKDGTATWVLDGAGSFSGNATVNNGILRVAHSLALGSTAGGTTVSNGATLQLTGDISVGAEALTLSGTGAAGQNGALVNLSGNNTYAGDINIIGPVNISSEAGSMTLGAFSSTGDGIVVMGAGNTTIGGNLTLFTGAVRKEGTGVFSLAGSNDFSGGAVLMDGIFEAASANAMGAAGTITFDGGVFRHGAGNAQDYSSRMVAGPGSFYRIATSGQTVTYASALAGSGNGLEKTGPGTLVLNASNTFDGATSVLAGKLAINAEDRLGANPAAFNASQLLLDGGTLNSTATFTLGDANRGVTLGVSGGTFETNASTTLTVSVPLTGAGQLTKTGLGTLLLNTVSTHTGGTSVQNGTLAIGVNNAISGDLTVSNGATLNVGGNNLVLNSFIASGAGTKVIGSGSIDSATGFTLNANSDIDVSAVLAGSGALSKIGNGTAVLSNANTYTGNSSISEGALFLKGGSLANGTVTVASMATFGGIGSVSGPVALQDGTGHLVDRALLDVGNGIQSGLNLLTLHDSLTLGEFAIIDFYLSSTGFTRLDVMGAVNLTATNRLRVNIDSGYIPTPGSSFDLFDWGSLNIGGGASLLDLLVLSDITPEMWDTSLFNTTGTLKVAGMAAPLAIIQQPEGGTFLDGDAVTLTAVVEGAHPFDVQWYKGMGTGNPVPGAKSLSLHFPAITVADSGSYWVRVTKDLDSVDSQMAVVDVVGIPRITTQPVGSTVFPSPGTNVTFTVEAIGPGTLTYVWKKGGNPIGGAPNAPSFTINDVQLADAGNYTVTVSNSFGEFTSDPAVLVVSQPIVFDMQPQPLLAVPEGNEAQFSVAVSGDGPFTYQWEFDPAGLPNAFSPLTGETSDTLVRDTVQANIGNYRVVVSNAYTSRTSNVGVLTFGSHLIVIDKQPESKIVAAGSTLELSVETSGGKPQTYQWFFKGRALPEETDPVLTITDVTTANAGQYFCRVRNALISGSDLEDSAVVTVAVVDTTEKRFVLTQPGTATMSVIAVADKTDILTFQWFIDQGPVGAPNPQPIPGATAKTYKATGLTAGRTRFFCQITGNGGMLNGANNIAFVYTQPPMIEPEAGWSLPDTLVSEPYAFQVPLTEDPFEAGQPDPLKTPVSFKAVGLPPGLTISSTGLISGRATVEKRDKITKDVIPYTVTITATNKFGTTTPIIKTLLVTPLDTNLVGTFTGVIERSATLNGFLGGAFNMSVTSKGAYSGKITMGAVNYSFKGVLNSSLGNPGAPTATVKVSRGAALRPLTLFFELNSTTALINVGTLTDGRTIANFTGHRRVWLKTALDPLPAQAYAGYYTLGMDLPAALQGTAANPLIPQGTSFASFTISSTTGALTVAGKLSDGTGFTYATFVGPTGEVAVFKTLYSTKARGSVVGTILVDQEMPADFDDNTISGTVSWWKPPQTGRTYPEGWEPIDLMALGSRYNPPPAGTPVMGLLPVLPGQINAAVQLLEANVETALPLSNVPGPSQTGFNVSNLNKAVPDVLNNPRKKTLVINAKTGAISGKFVLSGPHPFGGTPATIVRSVSYFGIIVNNGAGQQGFGYYLLPQLPSSFLEKVTLTPILSGQASFFATP